MTNNGCKSLVVSSHFFNLIMIKTVFSFTEGMVFIFLKNCSTGGKRKKKKWIVICVWKIRIFLLRGFFYLFCIKVHFKEIKQKAIERKGNILFYFSFLEGYSFFFHFFIYKLLILWRCFLLVLFFGGWGIFSVSLFLRFFLAVFFLIWRYFQFFLVFFFQGFEDFLGHFCITFFLYFFLCNFF